MPNPAGAYYDDGLTYWDDGSTWDSASATPAPLLVTDQPLAINTAMEFWEVTKSRAQETLPVWTLYLPTLVVMGKDKDDLEALIDGFEGLVQARSLAQDTYDQSHRACQDALLRMKVLGTKVPAIIDAQLSANPAILKDLADLYRNAPRTEGSILKRLRDMLYVWEKANTLLAAETPAQPAIVRKVGGITYTAALARTLLDSYTDLVKDMKADEEALDVTRTALYDHDKAADQLNKNWYQMVKASHDPGDDVYEALSGITTEPGTPAPETIEIDNVLQGGDEGLQVLVAYLPGGGAHATTSLVKWMVVGVDAGFTHSAPLNREGNALGPFTVGQVVRVITEVSNSSGTRTTAPRTITIQEPIG